MPRFTQKHYEAVADFIKGSVPEPLDKQMAEHLAYLFKSDNYKFDKGRFLKACQPDTTEQRRSEHAD